MQNARSAHKRLGKPMGVCDGGQFFIEHTGEGEQAVALFLQRDAHRADASGILGLAARQFLDDEVEQGLALAGPARTPGPRSAVRAPTGGVSPNPRKFRPCLTARLRPFQSFQKSLKRSAASWV